jgi:hypothetical protein
MFKLKNFIETDYRKLWKQQETKEIKSTLQDRLKDGFEKEFIASLFKQEIVRKEFYISDPQFRVVCNMALGRGYRFPILEGLRKIADIKNYFVLLSWKNLHATFSISDKNKPLFVSIPFSRTSERFEIICMTLENIILKREDNSELVLSKKDFQGEYWLEVPEKPITEDDILWDI